MPRLTKSRVLEEALTLLDQVGLDALTMRKLAEALGVQAGAIYWHYESKQHLLGAMAEQMLAGCVIPDPRDPTRWSDRLTAQLNAFRRALLTHRDGGRVFAGTFVAAPNTFSLAEVLVATLRAVGLSSRDAVWTAMSLIYFVNGFVVEEQAATGIDAKPFFAGIDAARFPEVAAASAHFVDPDHGARFAYGLELLMAGVQRKIEDASTAASRAQEAARSLEHPPKPRSKRRRV